MTEPLASTVRAVLEHGQAGSFDLRVADEADVDTVLGLLDDAVAWLNSIGITDQWGTRPMSSLPRRVRTTREWARSGGTVLALRDGEVCGVLTVGPAPEYVPAATCSEVYVLLLVTARQHRARGAGAALLAFADDVARAAGVRRMRVDCFAGGDRRLVRYYTDQGFAPATDFQVGDWPGLVLQRDVVAPALVREEAAR